MREWVAQHFSRNALERKRASLYIPAVHLDFVYRWFIVLRYASRQHRRRGADAAQGDTATLAAAVSAA